MPVTVSNEHPRLRVDQRAIARQLRLVLKHVGQPRGIIDVLLTDDDEIRQLNRDYRGRDEITDVLSFAIQDDPEDPGVIPHLGDIVISLDTADRQARLMPHTTDMKRWRLREEVLFLAVHGALHLLGYDHRTDEQALEMEALERHLFASVSGLDPHALARQTHGF